MAGGAPKGNTNAKKGKLWRDALERALARAGERGDRTVERGLDKVADTVVMQAIEGDKQAIQEIGNRIDGKPAQSVEITGDTEKPIGVLPFEFVKPANTE